MHNFRNPRNQFPSQFPSKQTKSTTKKKIIKKKKTDRNWLRCRRKREWHYSQSAQRWPILERSHSTETSPQKQPPNSYFPIKTHQILTILFPLTDTTEENRNLSFQTLRKLGFRKRNRYIGFHFKRNLNLIIQRSYFYILGIWQQKLKLLFVYSQTNRQNQQVVSISRLVWIFSLFSSPFLD